MARYRMTPGRRNALRKAQLASARKRKLSARSRKNLKRAAVGAGVVGVGAGLYAADRHYNTVVLYHSTTHARATRIAKNGFQHVRSRHNFDLNTGKRLSTGGNIYFAVGKNNTTKVADGSYKFGYATVQTRVRKKKLMKYSTPDDHPAAAMYGISNYRKVPVADLAKLGVKPRYKRSSKKAAKAHVMNYHHAPFLRRANGKYVKGSGL
jgi:hypothetical protein